MAPLKIGNLVNIVMPAQAGIQVFSGFLDTSTHSRHPWREPSGRTKNVRAKRQSCRFVAGMTIFRGAFNG